MALITLLGFAALAIDVGYMMVTRNELQNVADSAALAATRKLAVLYQDPAYIALTTAKKESYADEHRSEIVSYAKEVAITGAAFKVAGQCLTLGDADFTLGHWDPAAGTFTQTSKSPNAVRASAQRNSAKNGAVGTFLAGVVGVGSYNAGAMATAALTGLPKVPEGGLPIPVGISKAWFGDPDVYCGNPIKLYPTNVPGGCAGWHVYDQTPSSANMLKATIDGLNSGDYASPESISGKTQFDFNGGNIANALSNMGTLFNTMRVKNDGVFDQDTNSATWTSTVPVYDSPDCSAPNGTMTIVGFATIAITKVTSPPDPQEVTATIVCDKMIDAPGGGLDVGTLGGIPQLVQ
jgi:Flp pilus assembly protein TadG